jgi:ribonuclease HI
VPGINIEIRWCPAYKEVEGNEQADKWVKLTTEEPDAPGEEGLE